MWTDVDEVTCCEAKWWCFVRCCRVPVVVVAVAAVAVAIVVRPVSTGMLGDESPCIHSNESGETVVSCSEDGM